MIYINLKHVFDIQWQAWELARGIKQHNNYSMDHGVGVTLSDIVDIYVFLIIGILFGGLLFYFNCHFLAGCLFFYTFFLFTHMIPIELHKHRTLYSNLSVYSSIISISADLDNIPFGNLSFGTFITLIGFIITAIVGFIDLLSSKN